MLGVTGNEMALQVVDLGSLHSTFTVLDNDYADTGR